MKIVIIGSGISGLGSLYHLSKKHTIDLFDHILNIHPSLLPFGRGKYGYFWSIINSEPFGVTIHLVDEGIDSGKI